MEDHGLLRQPLSHPGCHSPGRGESFQVAHVSSAEPDICVGLSERKPEIHTKPRGASGATVTQLISSPPRAPGRGLTGNRPCLQARLHKTPLLRACLPFERKPEREVRTHLRKMAAEVGEEKDAARATRPFIRDSASGLRALAKRWGAL